MDSQLRVRVYNVGLGDCIYLRVPDYDRDVHILIDCGNKFAPVEILGERIAHLKMELPVTAEGKKRLDLLVATHPHEDSIKGFQEEYFQDIKIERIWLSPAFNLDTTERPAIDVLCNVFPQKNSIQPLYVTADTPPAKLKVFIDPEIQLKVLAPMSDIDRYYLGGEGFVELEDQAIKRESSSQVLFPGYRTTVGMLPRNISTVDFKNLLRRMEPSAPVVEDTSRLLEMDAKGVSGRAVNNLSVVLLLEWHGRRLLFPGDAEWSGTNNIDVKPGKSNTSWNVMWQERRAELSKPLDFLLVGHHGASIATPWRPPDKKGKEHPINKILDALLPKPKDGETPRAYVVVSTLRTERWPSIPDAALMEELGRRIIAYSVRTSYREEARSARGVPSNTPQPKRTDLEMDENGAHVAYIEFYFDPLT